MGTRQSCTHGSKDAEKGKDIRCARTLSRFCILRRALASFKPVQSSLVPRAYIYNVSGFVKRKQANGQRRDGKLRTSARMSLGSFMYPAYSGVLRGR